MRLSPDGSTIETIADTGGPPLGLEFLGQDELVVCDARAGLLAAVIAGVRLLQQRGRRDRRQCVIGNRSAESVK